MVQETASSGKVPCLAAAPRWGAEARAKTTAAASMGTRFMRRMETESSTAPPPSLFPGAPRDVPEPAGIRRPPAWSPRR